MCGTPYAQESVGYPACLWKEPSCLGCCVLTPPSDGFHWTEEIIFGALSLVPWQPHDPKSYLFLWQWFRPCQWDNLLFGDWNEPLVAHMNGKCDSRSSVTNVWQYKKAKKVVYKCQNRANGTKKKLFLLVYVSGYDFLGLSLAPVCSKHFTQKAELLALSDSQDCDLMQVSSAKDYWSSHIT